MIEIIIFHLHIIAALYGFTQNWQRRRFRDGFLAVLIIGLLFTIGWALTGAIARLVFPVEYNTTFFTQDSLSLVLLLIPEIYFFKYFILKDV
ncbi:MAG: hypothetical protein HW421_4123 [Ignavibacteria bacterium]|nr:hypothetical protein [Ignavibacteria bacterium]